MKLLKHLERAVLLLGSMFTLFAFGAETSNTDPFNTFSIPYIQSYYTFGSHPSPSPLNEFNYANGYSSNPFIDQNSPALGPNTIPWSAFNPGYASPLETLPSGTHMRVLILGQTGSGKSTFLNMAANYLLFGSFGLSPEQQKMLKIIIPTRYLMPTEQGFTHSEYNVAQQGKSQTSKPKSYRLGFVDRSITFIDTPGMGDTAGLDRDEKNLEKILKKASNGGALSGIILFFNGAETRDNTTKEYTFSKLIGSIPDVALKNMIVVLTNVRRDSCNFPLDKIRALGVDEDRIFYMQNSVLASDPETWRDAEIAQHLVMDWHDSMKTLGKIVQKLASSSDDISGEFKRMNELRNKVKHQFHQVVIKFSEMRETQYAIDEYESKYNREDAVAKDFKDYAQKAQVKTKKFIDDPSRHHSTVCAVHHTICHDQCGLEETHKVGDEIFTGCQAFNGWHGGARCTVCSSSREPCSFENHYHARGKFIEVVETLQDRLLEYKERYDDATANAQNARADFLSAEEALKQMQDTIDQFAKEVEKYLEELKKICKGYNFVRELQTTINILKKESNGYTSIAAKDSADQFIKALEIMAERLTEQGFDQGSSDTQDCTAFGHKINAMEFELDTRPKSVLSFLKGFGKTKIYKHKRH